MSTELELPVLRPVESPEGSPASSPVPSPGNSPTSPLPSPKPVPPAVPTPPSPGLRRSAKRKLTDKEIADKIEYAKVKALQTNVKTINPLEEASEINKAIQIDDWVTLEHLIELGEFTVDRESPTAKILSSRSMGGLSVLTNLCIDLSAPRCLLGLHKWAQNPDHNYWVSEKDLFQYAKQAALKGNLICCLTLMEEFILGGEDKNKIIDLANLLYPLSKSSDIAHRLGGFMYGKFKYVFFYPHLVYLSGQRGIHPLIIARTIQFALDSGEVVSTYDSRFGRITKVPLPHDDKRRTALSEAARVLNLDVLNVLLQDRSTRDGLNQVLNEHPDTEEYNPLFTLLNQDFPYFTPTNSDSDKDEVIVPPDDYEVYFKLHRDGWAMFESLRVLQRAMINSKAYKKSKTNATQVIARALEIYAATLRRFLIRKIRRHVPLKFQSQLIESSSSSSQPINNSTIPTIVVPESDTEFNTEFDSESEEPTYKFQNSLNGKALQTLLDKYQLPLETFFIRTWAHLTETELETINPIIDLIKKKIPDAQVNTSTNILYEYILDPANREDLPPPSPPSPAKQKTPKDEDDGRLRGSWTGIVRFGAPGGGTF